MERIGAEILKDPINEKYIPKATFLVVGGELSIDTIMDPDDGDS